MLKYLLLIGVCVGLAGCPGGSTAKAPDSTPLKPPQQASAPKNNPAAKYLELVGFRVKEKGAGKLEITFGVVNHSDADLGDMKMSVQLRTTASKAEDPPLCTFDAKVSGLGPQELKDVTVSVPSKIRVYELPDWQFIRSEFQLTEPR